MRLAQGHLLFLERNCFPPFSFHRICTIFADRRQRRSSLRVQPEGGGGRWRQARFILVVQTSARRHCRRSLVGALALVFLRRFASSAGQGWGRGGVPTV